MKSSLINVEPSSFRIAANAAVVVVVQHVILLRIRKKVKEATKVELLNSTATVCLGNF
jgi:hypothetical protein